MKMFWRLKIIVVLGCLWSLSSVSWASTELDTSVVCLTLVSKAGIVEKNQFFELFDFGTYVLVPLNSLPTRLGLEIEYLRNQGLVVVSSADKERQVKIKLKEAEYLVADKNVWEKQPPVVLKGSFYVTSSLIEFLAKVKLEWDVGKQELIIYGDWVITSSQTKQGNSNFNQPEDTSNALQGADYGLSLLSYQSSTYYQLNNYGETILKENFQLRADGRIGAWATSLGGIFSRDFVSQESAAELSLIRATYHENQHLIILGDSSFDLQQTMGKRDLRGFLYMYPDYQGENELLITTTVTGAAQPGDKVTLFVNGLQMQEEIIAEEETSYRFIMVPLLAKRTNLVKILIENATGKVEIIKRVTADSRILQKAEQQYLLAYGKYREPDELLWQGEMGGFRTHWGLSDRFTLSTETVRFIPENKNPQYGMVFGSGVKLAESLMFFGDWLAGGAETHVVQGWKANLVQSFSKGYLELAGFYVPPEVGENLQVRWGEGYTLLTEWNLNKNWSLLISGEKSNALPGMNEYQLQQGKARVGYAWGENSNHLLSGTFVKKSLLFQEIEQGRTLLEDTSSLIGEYQLRENGNVFKNQVVYSNSNFRSTNGELLNKIDVLGLYSENLYALTPSLWLGLSLDGSETWMNQKSAKMELMTDTQLKYLWGKNSLIGLGTTKWQSQLGSSELELFEWKISGIGQFELNPRLNSQTKISLINNRFMGQYLTARNNLNYSLNSNQTGLTGWLEYSIFYNFKNQSLWQGGLGVRHQFRNGLELNLNAEHVFEDPWGITQSNLLSLTLSQSIGFVGKTIHSFAYTDAQEISFVTGIVYLDENGNGKYDHGERLLPEIEMKLDGKVAKTDVKGRYAFYGLDPGLYRVGFNFKKLEADYTPLIGEQLFKVKSNQNFTLDFGLTINGVINGRFFLDRNANGHLDQDEKGLELVGVVLDDGKRKVFTDNDGTFTFENVPLGVHQLTVITDTLPQEMSLNNQGKVEIQVTKEDLDHNNLMFAIVYKFAQ